jgi:Methyltransferase domain
LVEGPAIDIGGGIGVCGLYLAKHRQLQEREHEPASETKSSPSIFITDGEPMAVEIVRRNRSLLGFSRYYVDIRRLLWSTDPKEITRQLVDPNNWQHDDNTSLTLSLKKKFRYVIGTDLLYYKTDATALVSTIDTMLAEDGGVAFLPCIIRSTLLPEQLLQAATELSLELSTIQLELFVKEEDLESIVGWYNIKFLIVQRKGRVLADEKLRQALASAGQRPFDPHHDESDSD